MIMTATKRNISSLITSCRTRLHRAFTRRRETFTDLLNFSEIKNRTKSFSLLIHKQTNNLVLLGLCRLPAECSTLKWGWFWHEACLCEYTHLPFDAFEGMGLPTACTAGGPCWKAAALTSLHTSEATDYSTVMVREKHFIQIKTQDKDFSVVAFVCDRVCHILVESWRFQGPIVAGTGSHSLYLFVLGSQFLLYMPVKSDMNTKLIKKWEFKKKKIFSQSSDLHHWSGQTQSAYQILFWSLICWGQRMTAAQYGSCVTVVL